MIFVSHNGEVSPQNSVAEIRETMITSHCYYFREPIRGVQANRNHADQVTKKKGQDFPQIERKKIILKNTFSLFM